MSDSESSESLDERDDKKKKIRYKRFQWSSTAQHLQFFFTYLVGWGGIVYCLFDDDRAEVYGKDFKGVSLIHLAVLNIVMGYPMYFAHTFIGQYCQKSCLFIGEMFPIAYGVGYEMLLLLFLRITMELYYMSKLLLFLFVSILNKTLPWVQCNKSFYSLVANCFGLADFDLCPTIAKSNETCFPPGSRTFSACIFNDFYVFNRLPVPPYNPLKTYTEPFYRLLMYGIHISIVYFLIVLVLSKGIRNFAVSLRATLIFCCGALLSILVVVFTRPGAEIGLYNLFSHFTGESFIRIDDWLFNIRRFMSRSRLGEGGFILFGSFMPESKPDSKRAVYLTMVCLAFITFSSVYFYFFMGLLIYKLNMSLSELGLETEENVVFTTYPMVLALHSSSYLFCLIYFIVTCLLVLHSVVLKVFVIEKSITEHFEIHAYKFYVSFTVISTATLLSYFLDWHKFYPTVDMIKREMKTFGLLSIAKQILIILTYGLQRFSDDIRFYCNVEVKKFTKFCWILTFFFLCVNVYYDLTEKASELETIVRVIFISMTSAPILIFAIIKTFSFMKQKNLIGLLRPSDLFGPPDIKKRILRMLYNPRLLIRSKQYFQQCVHKCIHRSKALNIAIQEEFDLSKNFLEEVKSSEMDPKLKSGVITTMENHEKIFLKVIKEIYFDENKYKDVISTS